MITETFLKKSYLKERSSHASNVLKFDSSIQMKNFSLSLHLLHPLSFGELFSERMSNSMRGHLMSSRIQCLDLTIVCPFVRDIKSAKRRTSVWVLLSVVEDLFIDFPVQVINGIIEGNHDNLRHLFCFQSTRNRCSSTSTVGQSTDLGIAFLCVL